jgi:hypothetical protein
MKIAVCISGMPRQFEMGWSYFIKNIIKFNPWATFHVYGCMWDVRGYWVPGDSKIKDGIKKEEKIDVNYVKTIYQSDNIILKNFDEYQDMFESRSKWFYDKEKFIPEINHSNLYVRVKNCISQLWSLKQSIEMIKNKKYDRVIQIRPDLVILNQLNLINFKDENVFYYLYQHTWNDGLGKIYPWYAGMGDKLKISNQKNMQIHGGLYDCLEELFLDEKLNYKNIFDLHMYYGMHFNIKNIKTESFNIPTRMFHTPAGEYCVQNKDGRWSHMNEANYEKIDRFKGKCGE